MEALTFDQMEVRTVPPSDPWTRVMENQVLSEYDNRINGPHASFLFLRKHTFHVQTRTESRRKGHGSLSERDSPSHRGYPIHTVTRCSFEVGSPEYSTNLSKDFSANSEDPNSTVKIRHLTVKAKCPSSAPRNGHFTTAKWLTNHSRGFYSFYSYLNCLKLDLCMASESNEP